MLKELRVATGAIVFNHSPTVQPRNPALDGRCSTGKRLNRRRGRLKSGRRNTFPQQHSLEHFDALDSHIFTWRSLCSRVDMMQVVGRFRTLSRGPLSLLILFLVLLSRPGVDAARATP